MIESLLQRDSNGSWTLPNSSIAEQIENRLAVCIHAISLLEDTQSLINLKSRIHYINENAVKEVDRIALAVQIMQVSIATEQLKSLHPNPPLFEMGKVPVADKEQLLLTAARDGNKEVVEFLLKEGAKVVATDKNGMQPIHFAAENGQIITVELLLSRGASVHAAANDGFQPLHGAARDGHKEVVTLLLKRGAEVNSALCDGCQPLHWAVINGHVEIVEILLSRGANIHAATSDGWLPIQLAEINGHTKIWELLHRARNLEPLLTVYQKKGHLTRFLDKKPFPIDKSFINLAIVDQKSYEDTEKKSRKLDRFLAENAFYDKPNCVELSRLFEGNCRIYVEGNAGSGKSTLCHYLAYNWATLTSEERLQSLGPWANHYEAVIWLPLREIQTLSKGAKLLDLIHKLYPGLIINSLNRDKTLYILDGFDEVVSLEEVCKNSEEDKRWEIVQHLVNQPHWLMTSRPGLFSNSFSTCRHLKNLGFTENNIKSYALL